MIAATSESSLRTTSYGLSTPLVGRLLAVVPERFFYFANCVLCVVQGLNSVTAEIVICPFQALPRGPQSPQRRGHLRMALALGEAHAVSTIRSVESAGLGGNAECCADTDHRGKAADGECFYVHFEQLLRRVRSQNWPERFAAFASIVPAIALLRSWRDSALLVRYAARRRS